MYLDNTAPVVSSLTAVKLVITAKATDSNSKVKYYAFSTSSSTPYSWNSTSETGSFSTTYTAPSAGTYYFHVKDTAGNTAYKSISVTK